MSLILIVEDNEPNLALVQDILQAKGHRTLEARTGEEGVRLAVEAKPDLVLMDIRLPGMNGIEALAALRANAATKRIPVIAVTASVMPLDRSLVTAAGFDGYLAKPISIQTLMAAVGKALGDATA
ncbi:MAG: response regulator [SAR324 cluster bacterium]